MHTCNQLAKFFIVDFPFGNRSLLGIPNIRQTAIVCMFITDFKVHYYIKFVYGELKELISREILLICLYTGRGCTYLDVKMILDLHSSSPFPHTLVAKIFVHKYTKN